MVLLAEVDFATQITITVIAAIGAAIAACLPVWLRYRYERKKHLEDLNSAHDYQQELEESLKELRKNLAQIQTSQPREDKPVDQATLAKVQELVRSVNQLVATVNQWRSDFDSLKKRVEVLEERPTETGPDEELEEEPRPLSQVFQEQLRRLHAALRGRGLSSGQKQIVVYDEGFQQTPVAILNKGSQNHRVLFHDGHDDKVLVSQLRNADEITSVPNGKFLCVGRGSRYICPAQSSDPGWTS